MLGRDKLAVVLWVTAGTAAVAMVVTATTVSRPDVVAIIVMAAALAGAQARSRCLDRRRMRRQRRADASVVSAADYVRGTVRNLGEQVQEAVRQCGEDAAAAEARLDRYELQIEAVYTYLASKERRRSGGQAKPKLRLVTDTTKDEAS